MNPEEPLVSAVRDIITGSEFRTVDAQFVPTRNFSDYLHREDAIYPLVCADASLESFTVDTVSMRLDINIGDAQPPRLSEDSNAQFEAKCQDAARRLSYAIYEIAQWLQGLIKPTGSRTPLYDFTLDGAASIETFYGVLPGEEEGDSIGGDDAMNARIVAYGTMVFSGTPGYVCCPIFSPE